MKGDKMENKTFKLTKDHITLLSNMLVEWDDCETGAPAIDPKRPYGNSNVATDIAELLGVKPDGDGDYEGDLSEDQEERLLKLHKETETALQIVLSNLGNLSGKRIEPGTYVADEYGYTWRKGK
jgi:hypothetical protein